MFCFIFKWMISRSHDHNKPFSGLITRHISHCKECQHYFRTLQSLKDRICWSATESLQISGPSLEQRINTALDRMPLAPAIHRRRYRLALQWAAALVIICVVSFFLFRIIPEKNLEPADPFTVGIFASLDTPNTVQNIVSGMETSFEKEMRLLGQYVKSAAKSLASGLHPEIYE